MSFQSKNIDWSEVNKIIENIANKIKNTDFTADIVAPIPKGGWTVASLLAQHLHIKDYISLSQEKNGNNRRTFFAGKIEVKGRKILVIEDSIETGKSLFDVKSELSSLGADVKTVALYVSKNFHGTNPDFYYSIGEIPVFPWEIEY